MSFVIALQGKESTKIVDGKEVRVIPFVGSDDEGTFSQMGIGILDPVSGRASIWGLVAPHLIIQSWRGMKILEKVKVIESGTLCHCWTVANRNMPECDRRHLESLAKQCGGLEKVNQIRDQVLNSVPGPKVLDRMITRLNEKGVDIDRWDLEEEIDKGTIAKSPTIQGLFQKIEQEKTESEEREKLIKKPLLVNESLSVFFVDLGISNFIIGGGIGAYGMDWGHIKIEELDETVKRDSLYLGGKFASLEHTTSGPETKVIPCGPGMTAYSTSFGEIEQPHFTAKDGTEYTFLAAKFGKTKHRFYVKTKVTKPGSTVTIVTTIPRLREMIGPLPAPEPPKKWWQKLFKSKG